MGRVNMFDNYPYHCPERFLKYLYDHVKSGDDIAAMVRGKDY